jgi:hypothetical protein
MQTEVSMIEVLIGAGIGALVVVAYFLGTLRHIKIEVSSLPKIGDGRRPLPAFDPDKESFGQAVQRRKEEVEQETQVADKLKARVRE